jgi:hypothetical protein
MDLGPLRHASRAHAEQYYIDVITLKRLIGGYYEKSHNIFRRRCAQSAES